jgi:hypothetical protein
LKVWEADGEEMAAKTQKKNTNLSTIRLRKIKTINKPLQNLNVPKQGMSKKNPSELENTEYSLQ